MVGSGRHFVHAYRDFPIANGECRVGSCHRWRVSIIAGLWFADAVNVARFRLVHLGIGAFE